MWAVVLFIFMIPQKRRFCKGAAFLRPLPPTFQITFPKGKSPFVMREGAWDNVRNGFCGEAHANLRGSSSRNAARSSAVPSRELRPQAAPARPPGGIPKGAQPSLASLCLLSAGQKVGARRGPSASKGEIKNLKKRKEDRKRPPPPRRRDKEKI